MVLAFAPADAQHLAAERGYLPSGVPLVKYVAALQGDRICADGLRVTINGGEAAIRPPRDSEDRRLPVWRGCKTLGRYDVFLLNGSVRHSFDGRYFGTIQRQNIVGKLRPLWVR
jgi:type IV secretory pathway protease TraF